MKMTKWLMKEIKDELCGAMTYAEKYIQYQREKPEWASMYKDMASAEISHADYIRAMAQEYIDGLSFVPEEDKERWQKCLAKYGEKKAWVNMMLTK